MSANDSADVLVRAARCLREEQDAALAGANLEDIVPASGEPTWSRIAGDVRRARRRRRWIVVMALQLGIGMGGVGVWAAVTGRLPTILRPPAAPAVQPGKAAAHARRHPAARPLASVEPSPAPAPSPAPRIETRSLPDGRIGRSHRQPQPVAVESGGSAADALYRQAHQLHFVRRDFGAALAAWDRYLATGAGPLALEARYNRAIALAHLDRRAEAIAALRPFADGETGSYRQTEARALIERFRSGN